MIKLTNPTVDALNNRLWYTDEETGSRYFLEVNEHYCQMYAARSGMNMAIDMSYFDFQDPDGQSYVEVFARSAIIKNRFRTLKLVG